LQRGRDERAEYDTRIRYRPHQRNRHGAPIQGRAGGHLDAAQIVNQQRLHIVQANRDFLAIAKKGDTSTLLGWSDQAIRKG
jgi:hypothetical protein